MHFSAFENDITFVRIVKAGKDAHERAFTGPVLTEHRMYLATPECKIHPRIGNDAGETLGDSPHFEHQIVRNSNTSSGDSLPIYQALFGDSLPVPRGAGKLSPYQQSQSSKLSLYFCTVPVTPSTNQSYLSSS